MIKQLEERIVEELKQIYDPEMSVNIYDLGLIYEIECEEKEGFTMCIITMTFTSAACPVGEMLYNLVQGVGTKISGFGELEILPKIVFEPPWSHEMMNDEVKLALGLL